MEILQKASNFDMLIFCIITWCCFSQLSSCCRSTGSTLAYKKLVFLFFVTFEGRKTVTQVEEDLVSP